MTHPTHTHATHGGRFLEVSEHAGTGPLEGQQLVIYHDLDKDVMSATTLDDWRQHWRPIAKNDCGVCLGTGTDQIKGNKAKPCGGCFGLGKVREDGETPKDRWEVAEIAGRIISELRCKVARAEDWLGYPPVAEAIEAHRQAARQATSDAQARQEREWRKGPGHGPGGRRHTGD